MLCLLTLLVVAVLATLSPRHRPLAREALDCVLRRIPPTPARLQIKEAKKVLA